MRAQFRRSTGATMFHTTLATLADRVEDASPVVDPGDPALRIKFDRGGRQPFYRRTAPADALRYE